MVRYSVIGSLYACWLQSGLLAFLSVLFRPLSLAAENSAFVRFLGRDSVIERSYRNSLFAAILRGIIDGLLYLPRRLYEATARARSGSRLLAWCSGSRLMNFELFLGAFICAMFIAPNNFWSNSYAILASGALFVVLALLAAAGKRPAFYPHELGFPFLLFVFACFFSLIFTRDMSDSFRVLMFFITAFLLTFIITAAITDEASLMKLMGFIYAAVMITALYAVVQRIMGVKVDMLLTDLANNQGVPGRVYATLDNPNNYAEFLVLFTPLCAAFAMNVKNPLLRLPLCLAIALPMLAMLMTYSRSGWISILIAALVFVYFAEKKLLPLVFVAGILALPFLPDSVMTRVASIFNSRDTSTAHRFYVWHGILMLLGDKGQWLTGIGLGPETFNAVYPAYARKWATEGVFHSQMLYLELFLELGALGFCAFMWMMFRNVKNAVFALHRTDSSVIRLTLIACCASFIGLAAASFVEYIWYYPRVLFAFFVLFGICLGATRINDKGLEETYE